MCRQYNTQMLGLVAAVVCVVLLLPAQANALKYMSLKEAIKHFLPEGTKPSKVAKRVPADKMEEIKKKFNLKESADFKEKISAAPYTIFVARDGNKKAQMYILILDQYWRTCYHKYAVGIQPNGTIKEVVVVEYSCKYAYPTNKRSFLKQFDGKKAAPGKVEINKDIDIVSGATASCDATAIVARRALALFELFFSQNS